MLNCLIVGIGGAIGAVIRYLIGLIPIEISTGFPIKTFLINILGSFIIGIVASLAVKNAINPKVVLFLKVGICGGFTTFSSFAFELNGLIEKGHNITGFLYAVLSVVLGFTAVFIAEKII